MLLLHLLFATCTILPSEATKFLVYFPLYGKSHVTFMSKLVDTLLEGGHEVHVLMPVIESYLEEFATKKANKYFVIPPCSESVEFERIAVDEAAHNLWRKSDSKTTFKAVMRLLNTYAMQCNATLNHPDLLGRLRAEHYDAALMEFADMCGLGVFDYIGVRSVALAVSVSHLDTLSTAFGVPAPPSYVPSALLSLSDKMTFLDRIKNMFPGIAQSLLRGHATEPMERVLRQRFGEHFEPLEKLCLSVSMVFVNGEPLIDFPKPTIHKIVQIGGISVSTDVAPLDKSWSDILDRRPQNVLISFGSVAKSHLMPDEFKRTIQTTIRKFPNVTFIWKYEKPEDGMSEGMENLVEAEWVPQEELLRSGRLSLFVTHGGQGSLMEAATAGVPLLVVPIRHDQFHNSAVAVRMGSAVSLPKDALSDGRLLESALRETLYQSKYADNARRIGEMLRDRPFPPKEIFLRNMEFLAKHGPLTQLNHYGQHLNFFQYFLIDVIAFITFIIISIIGLLMVTFRFLARKLIGSNKIKSV